MLITIVSAIFELINLLLLSYMLVSVLSPANHDLLTDSSNTEQVIIPHVIYGVW